MGHYPSESFSLGNRIGNLDIMITDEDLKGLSAFGHRSSNYFNENDEHMGFETPAHDNYILNKSDQKYKNSNI